MQFLRLPLLFFASLMWMVTHAQQFDSNGLIGLWDKVDQKDKVITFHFVDSINLNITNSDGQSEKATYRLTQDAKQSKITIVKRISDTEVATSYFIILKNGNLLTLSNTKKRFQIFPAKPVEKDLIFKKREPLE